MEKALFSIQAGVTDKDGLILCLHFMAVICNWVMFLPGTYCYLKVSAPAAWLLFVFSSIFVNLTKFCPCCTFTHLSFSSRKARPLLCFSTDAPMHIHFNPYTFSSHLCYSLSPSLTLSLCLFLSLFFLSAAVYLFQVVGWVVTAHQCSLAGDQQGPAASKAETNIMQYHCLHRHMHVFCL